MKKIIEVKNLTKDYGKVRALDNFSFDVKEGEIFGLLGPNGSGKTTAINSILGLLKIKKGEIKIFGKNMSPDAYDIKKDIGVVLQEVAVFNELTVYENIDYFCGLYVTDNAKRKELIAEALEIVGLEKYQKFYPPKLSGGLKRRLNIACGIAHKPKLLFLDEPTVAVDPQSRNNILESIKELNKNGTTIVYTTHYMEEVEFLCNRVLIIDNGKSVAEGTIEQLKNMIDIGEKVDVEFINIDEKQIKKIKELKNVKEVIVNDNLVTIYFAKKNQNMVNLLELFKQEKLETITVNLQTPTLNDVFLEITGRELRD